MQYKVGDKVRITKYGGWSKLVGEECVVIIAKQPNSEFICRIKHTSSNWDCLMLENEIEPVTKVGQQLLFDFMTPEAC